MAVIGGELAVMNCVREVAQTPHLSPRQYLSPHFLHLAKGLIACPFLLLRSSSYFGNQLPQKPTNGRGELGDSCDQLVHLCLQLENLGDYVVVGTSLHLFLHSDLLGLHR